MESVMYSIVIPVYNGEKSVQELAGRISNTFEEIKQDFEMVFIDDNSTDNSWAQLMALAMQDKRIKAIKLAQNAGQHSATLCGFSYARGNYIITMDDDLQHYPEDIPKLIEKMKATECDVVIARLLDKKYQWYRKKASHGMKILNEVLSRKPKNIHLSSFRLLKREVVENIFQKKTSHPYLPALIFSATQKVANVGIHHGARTYGQSNYTLTKMFKLAFRLILNSALFRRISFTAKPAYTVEQVYNL